MTPGRCCGEAAQGLPPRCCGETAQRLPAGASVKRLAAAPIFVQALALVVLTVVAAQLSLLPALLAMALSRRSWTYDDVAAAVRAAPANLSGQGLDVVLGEAPPAHWAGDSIFEARARATLADLL